MIDFIKPLASPDRCPCCGQLNQCAQNASAVPVTQCWCFQVQIAPHKLQQVPAELRNRNCLCPSCARDLPADVD